MRTRTDVVRPFWKGWRDPFATGHPVDLLRGYCNRKRFDIEYTYVHMNTETIRCTCTVRCGRRPPLVGTGQGEDRKVAAKNAAQNVITQIRANA